MLINIIGQHPVPQPGFPGVMSLYEALWFSRFGDDVVLYLPFPTEAKREKFRRTLAGDFNDLEKLGGAFSIEPVLQVHVHDGEGLRPCDVTIWQSRDHDAWATLYPIARERSRIVTKNFPKLIPRPPQTLHPHVVAQMEQFDFVAFALQEDLAALQAEPAFTREWEQRMGYVPRGADPLLLHPGYKAGRRPVVAVDTPNTGDVRAVAHYHGPLKRLKKAFPDLEVLTLGRGIGLDWATTVPFGRFDQVYDRFFNRAWLYLTIDYGFSPQHLQGTIHQLDEEGWARKAIYEVQNVEAQMSGAVVVGHAENLIPELYQPGESGVLFRSADDADEIFDCLAGVIDDYGRHRAASRAWALERHSWEACIRAWREGLLGLLASGYERGSSRRGPAPATTPEVRTTARAGVAASPSAPRLRMSPGERAYFLAHLQRARAMVEYGAGGSTLAATQAPLQRIYTVETDRGWLEQLTAEPGVAHAVAEGRLRPVHIDLGPTHSWGYPETETRRGAWPRYAEAVWDEQVREPIDLVLIDGRFRVYSALCSLQHLAPGGVLLFHDFWDRPYYREVLGYADVVDRCETFAALRPNAGLAHLEASDVERFRFDPR